jgi:hypothetical protein
LGSYTVTGNGVAKPIYIGPMLVTATGTKTTTGATTKLRDIILTREMTRHCCCSSFGKKTCTLEKELRAKLRRRMGYSGDVDAMHMLVISFGDYSVRVLYDAIW